jgi:hypothetical protein
VFKPDAFVRLRQSNLPQRLQAFTTTTLWKWIWDTLVSPVQRQADDARRYLESGVQQTSGRCFKTLVITTGEKRLKNLRPL